MSRLDRKRGRFHNDFETDEINRALAGWQSVNGDTVDYYRFDREDSVENDIYDEGSGQGKVYKLIPEVPVLHVIHTEGPNADTENGFYYNDDLHLTASFDLLDRVGLKGMDLDHQTFLKDRLVYDERVWRITSISVLGQIQRRDVIVSMEATQVHRDELVDDAQFSWVTR